jgi:Zn-dependent protease
LTTDTHSSPASTKAQRRPRGLRLARIAGIDVFVDWSLLIIFVLFVTSLAGGVFPAWHPDWSVSLAFGVAIGAALLFFASVLAHEMSHALVGRRYGMTVRRITLFIFGGVAHLEDEPEGWKAEFGMAIVGPLTSLVIGVLCLWLVDLATAGTIEPAAGDPLGVLSSLGPLPTLLVWLGQVNIILAIFNLVPGFPLDGGRVLRAAIWGATGDRLRATRIATGAGQVFAWVLISSGIAMILGLRVPVFGAGAANGLWLAFIGWFLHSAAVASYRQVLPREA